MLTRIRIIIAAGGAAIALGGGAGMPAGSASTMPSGQVMFGNTLFSTTTMTFTGGGGTIEPAYNSAAGQLIYLQTPNNAHVNPNSHNVAPLYLPVYPAGSGIDPASLNCAHVPADNCPDHGPGVAGAAMSIIPAVYGGGVLGHDHLAGIASSGGDFNVIWEPVLVLFTSKTAARQHITTLAQVTAELDAHQAITVPLPQFDFHCTVVSAAAYHRGTPAPTVTGP